MAQHSAFAGLKIKLTNAIGLRLEARNVLLVPKKHYDKAHIDNIVAGAGLVFAFGGKVEDSDGDGVPDKLDRCPNTPAGCRVDASGCPIDSDGDGVCDGLDQCANTPRGATVDARGCPKDSDGDGVRRRAPAFVRRDRRALELNEWRCDVRHAPLSEPAPFNTPTL